MRFHFYHEDTGDLHHKSVTCDMTDKEAARKFAERNAPPHHIPISGNFDPRREKVDVATLKVILI
jgi:hypothetical protein